MWPSSAFSFSVFVLWLLLSISACHSEPVSATISPATLFVVFHPKSTAVSHFVITWWVSSSSRFNKSRAHFEFFCCVNTLVSNILQSSYSRDFLNSAKINGNLTQYISWAKNTMAYMYSSQNKSTSIFFKPFLFVTTVIYLSNDNFFYWNSFFGTSTCIRH